ncbi:hypothetical protein KXD93_24735 [Mucilaginibacter sp. BJC16-A38]|uniref:hypothetical protein n=1 Tax=Mucilaginibacter phenanthrenivorans TaxID=1234842 RepID=UPI002157A7C2|nr:hypothetical protein [Mucilaginibacter phenanthrenivorans]MCR8560887.1 hypothetical protein [Mucilaginibacter phenanthrenivorans]
MSEKDLQILIELAKKLEKGLTKEEALRSFVAAGILDEAGNYTQPYKELGKIEG